MPVVMFSSLSWLILIMVSWFGNFMLLQKFYFIFCLSFSCIGEYNTCITGVLGKFYFFKAVIYYSYLPSFIMNQESSAEILKKRYAQSLRGLKDRVPCQTGSLNFFCYKNNDNNSITWSNVFWKIFFYVK